MWDIDTYRAGKDGLLFMVCWELQSIIWPENIMQLKSKKMPLSEAMQGGYKPANANN